jgi:hypothetical protein
LNVSTPSTPSKSERLADIKRRLEASPDQPDAPIGDETTQPPEPWRSSPDWDPSAVAKVIRRHSEGKRAIVSWPGGLTDPKTGRHFAHGAMIRARIDADESIVDAWAASGDALYERSELVMYYLWGSMKVAEVIYLNAYRLVLEVSESVAKRDADGAGLGGTHYAVAIRIPAGTTDADLPSISCPPPRLRWSEVVAQWTRYPLQALVRFEHSNGSRMYLTEAAAIERESQHAGRIMDVGLLSPEARRVRAESIRRGRLAAGDFSAAHPDALAAAAYLREHGR